MPWGYAVSFSWLALLCSRFFYFSLCLLLLLSESGRALGVLLSYHFQLVLSVLPWYAVLFARSSLVFLWWADNYLATISSRSKYRICNASRMTIAMDMYHT